MANGPAFITLPLVVAGSWQCCMKHVSAAATASRIRRIIASSAMPSPSSEIPMAPAWMSSSMGAMVSPCRPMVPQPTVCTRARSAAAAFKYAFDLLDVVQCRRRVRHAADRGESTGDRGGRSAVDGFVVCLSVMGITEMDVDIEQSRGHDAPRGVDGVVGGWVGLSIEIDGRDPIVGDQHVTDGIQPGGWIDDSSVADQDRRHVHRIPAG